MITLDRLLANARRGDGSMSTRTSPASASLA